MLYEVGIAGINSPLATVYFHGMFAYMACFIGQLITYIFTVFLFYFYQEGGRAAHMVSPYSASGWVPPARKMCPMDLLRQFIASR